MRYVAKLHVLDVLDHIVVSGYVYDADVMSNVDHESVEFSFDVLSYGHDNPRDWLTGALYSALTSMNSARHDLS